MRISIFLLLSVFSIFITHAGIGKEQAEVIANEYVSQNFSLRHSQNTENYEVSLAYTEVLYEKASAEACYIFNIGNNDGFVIVSAFEKGPKILGYSDKGSFEYKLMPDNMKYWLHYLGEELLLCNTQYHNTLPPPTNTTLYTSENGTQKIIVEPLLKCEWNQGAPYNNKCPMDDDVYPSARSYTGCVATAMAQIMYYHQYPNSGTGSSNSGTQYQWKNMLPKYSFDYSANKALYTEEQADAVAQLMLDCGQSVFMEYSSEASSAFTCYVPGALCDDFGYDKNSIRLYYRDIIPYQEMIDILYGELQAKRPVYVNGANEESGHAFVLDGSDGNGYFHINWGWGGSYNGYYRISALEPTDIGIGGTRGGYNTEQSFITGIQPSSESTPETDHYPQLIAMGDLIIRDGNFTTTGGRINGFMNNGIDKDKKRFYICSHFINQETGEESYSNKYSVTIDIGRGFSSLSLKHPYNPNLKDGTTYIIEPLYRLYDENENDTAAWHCFSYPIGCNGHVTAEYTLETGLRMITNTTTTKSLQMNDFTCPDTIYINIPSIIDFSIKNISHNEYFGYLKANVIDPAGELSYSYSVRKTINILPDETIQERMELNFDKYSQQGKYSVYMSDFRDNVISDTLQFIVYEYKIPIDEKHFPDTNFRDKISSLCDKDKNGSLSFDEIKSTTYLSVANAKIKSLRGIEYLTNLYTLYASGNEIDTLIITNSHPLQTLKLYNNQVNVLDLSGCNKITSIDAQNNPISKFVIPEDSEISSISISNANLDTLDLHGKKSLATLDCARCNIEYLNLDGCSSLKSLNAGYNKLTHFNADEFPNLNDVLINGNERQIEMNSKREFNLQNFINEGFILSRASGWEGCTINGNIITVPRNPSEGTIRYAYDIFGSGFQNYFTLKYKHNDIGLVENLSLDSKELAMYPGDSRQLNATVSPDDAENKALKWSSSNTQVVTVSATGVVTAVAPGEADVTVSTTDNSNLSAVCHVIVSPRLVSSINISHSKVELTVGKSISINANAIPTNATNRTLKWSTADPTIATVTSSGRISGAGIGETDITVSATDGSGVKETCHVTVTPVYVKSITLSETEIEIEEGATHTLKASVKPREADNKKVSWSSMNTSVATVDSTGVVKGISKGKAEVRVTAQDGSGVMAICNVTVTPVYVKSITLSETEIEIEEGATHTLKAIVAPQNANNKSISWSSMDTGVATVDSTGVVKGISKGKAEIRVTAQDGSGVMAICNVTVVTPAGGVDDIEVNKPSITVTEGEVLIEGISDETVIRLYNIAGQLIRMLQGSEKLQLSRGIYLLQINGQIFKIAI